MERIKVYSVGGILLYQTDKQAGKTSFLINGSEILIVRGSSGWEEKVQN
jgi:hypothetical protein